MIITASSTTGPSLALNPLIANRFDGNQTVVQTYSVNKPKTAGGQETYQKIIDASVKYGLDTDTALRIAKCESNLRQYNEETGNPLRGQQNPKDVGVYQINEEYHLEQSQVLGFDIYQKDGNIEYAMWLMKKEGNRHWNWSKPCWNKDSESNNV